MSRVAQPWPRALGCVASLFLWGCAGVSALSLDEANRPAPRSGRCQLDVSVGRGPTRAHQVFGWLERQVASSSYASGSRADAVEALRPTACGLGADGIVIADEDSNHVNMRVALIHYTDTGAPPL